MLQLTKKEKKELSVEEKEYKSLRKQIQEKLSADYRSDKNIEVDTIDGIRLTTPDGWLLLRASNTQNALVARIEGFSKEICTGPHVKNTRELGKFRIKKEESVAAGVRRIKAVLE